MVVPNHDGLPDCRDEGPDFEHLPHMGDSPRPLIYSPYEVTTHYEAVREFAIRAGNQVPEKPKAPSPKDAVLCARLILEEAMETIDALGVEVKLLPEHTCRDPIVFRGLSFQSVRPADLVEVIDGCCDTHVVSTFTMVMCGVCDDGPQSLVDANNLGKFDPALGGKRCPSSGKWIKPPNYPKPDIAQSLKDQGWEG